MKTAFVRWLGLALGATVMAGSLVTGAAAKDLTVTTWTATSPGLKDWWKVIEEKFEKANPGVDVKIENIAFGDYIRTLTTRFVAGSAPSIVHVPLPTINLPAWAEAGFLQNVDDRIAGTDIATKWPANQASMTWKGVNYGVLLVHYGYVFFVNEKMFKDAGIAIPTNKVELLAAARALTKNGKYGFAITDDNTVNFMRDALEFVSGLGGQWAKDGAWNFTDPTVVEAIDLWREIGQKYAPRGTDINAKRQAFYDGNVAMMIENPSVWPNVAAAAKPDVVGDLHLATMPFKVVPGDVSHGFSIPQEADAETAKLAWAFTEMAASPDLMRSYVELVKSPVARPGVDQALLKDKDTVVIAKSAENAEVLIPNDYYGVRKNYAAFSTELTNTLRTILQGQAETKEALAGLQERLNAKGITP
ncbi:MULTISPECIES: extracellular solute-binding protein [unclassified Chelatococcus]|uniref:ABC transporter substrate-binding protein n=1 Tax=unclassified Chelatococcus TaxID=2638111 RepID=UPI001BD0B65D|nr:MULTISPECIES: extracellular solute-binding protein [unclassified Chelatococcus]MBS7699884.1 extracellular solute-binding protein [Chelatococcus sp. YT9]MBX3558770.1 extracellular solute-binding protein [Chelatococcus sp.]